MKRITPIVTLSLLGLLGIYDVIAWLADWGTISQWAWDNSAPWPVFLGGLLAGHLLPTRWPKS